MPSGASASSTALWTAGPAPIVPDSPMPFTPSGLSGVGVTVPLASTAGSSFAVGTA